MKLNRFETLLMNNPVRAFVQRHYEAPRLAALAPRPLAGTDALVIGCGRGIDVAIAFDLYMVGTVTAFDLDEKQVERARHLLGDRYGDRLRLSVGDAADMPFADDSFDLALDFGIIHHVPVWQKAVREVQRVLRPGGQFLFEEIPRHKLHSLHYRTLSRHPHENRFEMDEFCRECKTVGLVIGDRAQSSFGFFRGAALKQAS